MLAFLATIRSADCFASSTSPLHPIDEAELETRSLAQAALSPDCLQQLNGARAEVSAANAEVTLAREEVAAATAERESAGTPQELALAIR